MARGTGPGAGLETGDGVKEDLGEAKILPSVQVVPAMIYGNGHNRTSDLVSAPGKANTGQTVDVKNAFADAYIARILTGESHLPVHAIKFGHNTRSQSSHGCIML